MVILLSPFMEKSKSMIMKLKLFGVLLISTLFFIKCTHEGPPCPDPYDMGTFELLESSKNRFPYDESQTKAIFSDSLGNEFTGSISVPSSGFGINTISPQPCVNNEEIKIAITANAEHYGSSLSIPELDLRFNIRFRVLPKLEDYESNSVADLANIIPSGTLISNASYQIPPQLSLVLDRRSRPEEFQNPRKFTSALSIHGKVFGDVYTNSIEDDIIIFHFSFIKGIVGFKDQRSGIYYKLERIE